MSDLSILPENFFDGWNKKNSVLAIVGPTASGKSSLAFKVAELTGGEIVSCDSMQVYRGMDIGTAKPTPEEMTAVRHHLIDVADPDQPFSCADYTRLARAAIDRILSAGRLPIVCGGTGLYYESAVRGRTMESPGGDPELRKRLESASPEENYARLCEADPESAAKIHPNNVKRVIRALEIYMVSGVTKTEWDRRSTEKNCGYDTHTVVLEASDRDYLYRRIDARVDKMISDGLEDEVRRLSPDRSSTAGQAIGYKEFCEYFRGECSVAEAAENIKRASRNYAKRQITWFKRYDDVLRLDICAPGFPDDFVKLLLKNIC